MTRTNVIFSAVDFVENLRKALGYPIFSIMEEKVKGMFDDAGFADEFETDIMHFIGNGTLEKPQYLLKLSNKYKLSF